MSQRLTSSAPTAPATGAYKLAVLPRTTAYAFTTGPTAADGRVELVDDTRCYITFRELSEGGTEVTDITIPSELRHRGLAHVRPLRAHCTPHPTLSLLTRPAPRSRPSSAASCRTRRAASGFSPRPCAIFGWTSRRRRRARRDSSPSRARAALARSARDSSLTRGPRGRVVRQDSSPSDARAAQVTSAPRGSERNFPTAKCSHPRETEHPNASRTARTAPDPHHIPRLSHVGQGDDGAERHVRAAAAA
jgi:hypothetical protein